jgi:Acetyltransferases
MSFCGNKIEILPVIIEDDIRKTASLAEIIWHETYDKLLPPGQPDYMIEKFQSEKAMKRQIETEGYKYFLVSAEEENTGFFALVANSKKQGEMLISKVYLHSYFRGKGIVGKIFAFIDEYANKNNQNRLWLTVNKENIHAQDVYKHFGFEICDSVVSDIGNGYVMDDYIFEKLLK